MTNEKPDAPAAYFATQVGDLLRSPSPDWRTGSNLGKYMTWLARYRGRAVNTHAELWHWSVDDLTGFWSSIWDYYGVRGNHDDVLGGYVDVLINEAMPGTEWFPGAMLNYAEHMVGTEADAHRAAIISYSQTRPEEQLTFGELQTQVGRARAGLQRLGVGRGDAVAAYLPNIPETIVAFLAVASVGATWASCPPEFGAKSVIDRLGQIQPTVLLMTAGYGYRDRYIDRTSDVAEIRAALPTVRHVVHVPYGEATIPGAVEWADLTAHGGPLEFDPVPFDYPLYVLFTSGTTGLPKPIVHGHGGVLLEHLKWMGLGLDLGPTSTFLWYTTTGWMMWNALISGLLVGSTIVLVDGDPAWPHTDELWRIAEASRATFVGMSPGYIAACRKVDMQPGATHDLSAVVAMGTSGSPLSPDGAAWLYEQVGPHLMLNNLSGGTDICTALVGGSPALPVYAGELSGPCLGVAVTTFDDDGNEVYGQVGELVVTKPMPSMPVAILGDADGSRYASTYFEPWPGVWRQGDWAELTNRGSFVISGRSDATLNRGGVRLGTSELYAVVEALDSVADSLAVHLEDAHDGPGELILFVVRAPNATAPIAEIATEIIAQLRRQLSPRHAPDTVMEVESIPRTLSGKKLESPVKKMLRGADPDKVASRQSLVDPCALDAFAAIASARLGR